MEHNRQTIRITVALFFAVSMAAAADVCLARAQESFDENLEQKFEGFNLEGYADDGSKSWDVHGDTANVLGADIELSNVNANSYGEQNVNVTAEVGKINQASGDMRLERDVIVTSEDGMQLLTDSLDWNRNDDLVTTEDDVLIHDKSYTITGKGMKAQPGLKTAEVKEDVVVRVDTDLERQDDKIVTITSDGPMVIDQSELVATFTKNVVAVQYDRTLKADRMEVYFNEAMDEIQKMICIGNVEIIQGENQSFAQKAVYDAVKQTVTLTGRPKLRMVTEGENAITASGD